MRAHAVPRLYQHLKLQLAFLCILLLSHTQHVSAKTSGDVAWIQPSKTRGLLKRAVPVLGTGQLCATTVVAAKLTIVLTPQLLLVPAITFPIDTSVTTCLCATSVSGVESLTSDSLTTLDNAVTARFNSLLTNVIFFNTAARDNALADTKIAFRAAALPALKAKLSTTDCPVILQSTTITRLSTCVNTCAFKCNDPTLVPSRNNDACVLSVSGQPISKRKAYKGQAAWLRTRNYKPKQPKQKKLRPYEPISDPISVL